jgi:FkbM family methyltransferase
MNNNVCLHTISTRYGRMTFFTNDSGAVSQSLKTYGEWAENELTFAMALLKPGATVVDVGAYIGTHTLSFAHFVGPEGRVIAIEPQDESFKLLKKNVLENRLANVRLEHAAAGSGGTFYTSPLEIEATKSFGSTAMLHFEMPDAAPSLESGGIIPVRGLTIDSLELASCALIKIDVEGLEHFVISGAEQTINRLSPAIYAECNSVDSGIKTFELLRNFGYYVRMHIVDAFNPDNVLGITENIFGAARECALVGLKGMQLACVDQMQTRPCELILKIESADDLALGMLNKPQYFGEILQMCAAARSGGDAWLKDIDSLQNRERTALLQRDEAREIAHQALEQARLDREAVAQASEQARLDREAAAQALEQARLDREAADRAEKRLEGMRNSRSWRLTKPFREVRRIFQ